MEAKAKSTKISVREICYIAMFTAIITVCAQISIPMPAGVPMTLQTFAIPLAGIVLGTRNGTLAALVYILLGAFGVPVFAGLTGGMAIVFGRTGGFILSFPLMALTAGIGAKKSNIAYLVLWLTIGAVINFFCGMLMFSLVNSSSLPVSFTIAVAPFIPTAVVKIAMVAALGKPIREALEKAGAIV
ncbi:MAG: biotin transporter BioY [Oscillospiraceae bacterium]|nr:biotin transporter BioY [Oscillospiraceae bacterium]